MAESKGRMPLWMVEVQSPVIPEFYPEELMERREASEESDPVGGTAETSRQRTLE
jgi:hypothetical protein